MHLSTLRFMCQILAQSDKVDRSFCKVILSPVFDEIHESVQVNNIYLCFARINNIDKVFKTCNNGLSDIYPV